jgi:hypothetical protein
MLILSTMHWLCMNIVKLSLAVLFQFPFSDGTVIRSILQQRYKPSLWVQQTAYILLYTWLKVCKGSVKCQQIIISRYKKQFLNVWAAAWQWQWHSDSVAYQHRLCKVSCDQWQIAKSVLLNRVWRVTAYPIAMLKILENVQSTGSSVCEPGTWTGTCTHGNVAVTIRHSQMVVLSAWRSDA